MVQLERCCRGGWDLSSVSCALDSPEHSVESPKLSQPLMQCGLVLFPPDR